MAESIAEESADRKNDQWRERIAEHERSGLSVRRFCKEQSIPEHLFFYWRKRLRNQQQPVRFALVDRGAKPQRVTPEAGLELMLATGERLRIGTGVSATTLRTVLEVLRA
jgi:transposase-like protein